MTNLEKKSRMIVGVLALIALGLFLAFTFGSSDGVLIGMIAIGITLSLLIFSEVGIVSYISKSKYKSFGFSDIMVIVGTIVGAALFIFSISLIPTIGQLIPEVITNFTTTFARIIAGIAALVVMVFIFTPKFE